MFEYDYLFRPLLIKSVKLKNRIIMAPMATRFAAYSGHVTPRLTNYYAARAQGGVGLVTVEAAAVSPEGRGWECNLAIYHDKFISGLAQLAETIHQNGAKAAIEIFHAGRRAQTVIIGQQPVAPSPVPCTQGEVPRELTVSEISRLIDNFAFAALRAKQAGFDIVNLHIAHGYILQQFLSPLSNKRSDIYGGGTEGRARLVVEIIKRIRTLVGKDYPIFGRVTVDEYTASGLDLTEFKKIAYMLEGAGLDLIDVSAGGPEAPHKVIQPMTEPRGCLVHLAEGIKESVSIPVAVVGRINNPQLAEEILSQNKADLIAMGRPLIADPDLPNKALQGKEDEIRPCIACNQGCSDRRSMGAGISCLANPLAGREGMIEIIPVSQPKNTMVVGGGVAGMEAALIAAQRGHKVILFEKSNFLGGQALLAAKPPRKEEIYNLVKYFMVQLERLGVSVNLGKEAGPAELERFNPDEIIIATGAVPLLPQIPGLNSERVLFAWDVLRDSATTGNNVLIIGGGQVGCETAEYLLEQGKQVTVLEMAEKIVQDMSPGQRKLLNQRLIDLGADVLTRTKVIKVDSDAVYVERLGIELVFRGFDSIVFATGARPYNPFGDHLRKRLHYVIGDSSKSARLLDAIHAGFNAGNSV